MKDFPKRALILYSNTDTKGRKDATGAFIPEAKKLKKYLEDNGTKVEFHGIDTLVPKWRRTARVESIIDSYRGDFTCKGAPIADYFDYIGFFCHGWSSGIQFGYNFRNIDKLVKSIETICSDDVIVSLYACLTADDGKKANNRDFSDLGAGTDGGFADQLRDRLCAHGVVDCRILAHKTAGHTTYNPYVVVFDGDGTPYGLTDDSYEGGEWLVSPNDELWKKWRIKLRSTKNNLKFDIAFMSSKEIKKSLSK